MISNQKCKFCCNLIVTNGIQQERYSIKFLIPVNILSWNGPVHMKFLPRLNRRPFADDIFKSIFLNENEWISPRISLKFVPKVRINNIPALVQIMAWRRSGDKPLSEPMMVSLLTHICVTRPQWVKYVISLSSSCIFRWILFSYYFK